MSNGQRRRSQFVICHALSGRRVIGILTLALAVIVVASAVAWDGTVPRWEVRALELFNGLPGWLEPIMWAIQQVGVLAAPLVAGVIVVLFTRRWQHLIPFVMVLPLKLGIEKGIVKQLVERQRPFVSVGPEVNVRGPAFEGLSFPSGHATTAFAAAILLAAFLPPRWRVVPVTWAILVAVARMYFGEHNLLDVVAGAAMGTGFAAALWFVFLNRFVHPECDCARP